MLPHGFRLLTAFHIGTLLGTLLICGHADAASARVRAPRKPAIVTTITPGIQANTHANDGCKTSPKKRRSRSNRDPASEEVQETRPKTLILFDSTADEATSNLNRVYAIMLQSLLGHFNAAVEITPVEKYLPGDVEKYDATFYLGGAYDNPIPDSFLSDVNTTQKKIVWFKYNLWQLTWNPALDFRTRFGINFVDLRGLNAQPTPTQPTPGFFDTVLYKGKSLAKYYNYDKGSGTIAADPDAGEARIENSKRAEQMVPIQNSKTGEKIPYIIRAGSQDGIPAQRNFWYFADLPLSFIGPRDRYLVLCDILHDILGIQHQESHRAMVRLEDVSAQVTYASMKKLTDYLTGKRIPFSVAAIPFYRDPLGHYNDGVPNEVPIAQATELKKSLQYAVNRGATIVMHGYTHQYESQRNTYSGASADDFEFWDAVKNAPVAKDSESWASDRVTRGLLDLKSAGYTPIAWEPPHYQASPTDYRVFAKIFKTTYQRVVYYSSEKPNLDPLNPARDFSGGMFFPYVIQKDAYGQRILPENLGNIEYDISSVDPSSNFNYTWKDLLTNAEYGLVVRDGFASFFFHPFWVEPDFNHLNAYGDFQNLVNGISKLGYSWVAPNQVSDQG